MKSPTPRKTSMLMKIHVVSRLNFSKDHLEKGNEYWKTFIWFDETKIELFGRNATRLVLMTKGTAYDRKNAIPTVKHGGGSIMVWACLASHGTGALHIIDGRMDGAVYCQISEKSFIHSAKRLFEKRKWTFQHDNDLKHAANLTREWFNKRKINVLQWL